MTHKVLPELNNILELYTVGEVLDAIRGHCLELSKNKSKSADVLYGNAYYILEPITTTLLMKNL
jgi:hypothetical protein